MQYIEIKVWKVWHISLHGLPEFKHRREEQMTCWSILTRGFFFRTWWWATRRVSFAPCWRWTTPWRTASSGTGTTWSTCGITLLVQRSSTLTHATARFSSLSHPWIPPKTVRRSLRCVPYTVQQVHENEQLSHAFKQVKYLILSLSNLNLPLPPVEGALGPTAGPWLTGWESLH